MNKLMTNLVGTFLVLTGPSAQRRERGQGSLEYVGMIAVAAIIIVAVAAVAKTQGPLIGQFITDAIAKVKGGI
jgi:hypothetical protein